MKKHDKLHAAINYLLESIDIVNQQTSCTYADFIQNRILVTSTIYYLERIADATMHIPEELKGLHDKINWKQVKGFRNFLVHEYLEGYDHQIIWATIKDDLPLLKNVVLEIKKYKYNE
jgi:uncharacterized protein with HEPN domain